MARDAGFCFSMLSKETLLCPPKLEPTLLQSWTHGVAFCFFLLPTCLPSLRIRPSYDSYPLITLIMIQDSNQEHYQTDRVNRAGLFPLCESCLHVDLQNPTLIHIILILHNIHNTHLIHNILQENI